MTLKYQKIRNAVAGSALVLASLSGPSVFADGLTPIPVGFDERPQFELTKIDLTNNKLDFGINNVRLPGNVSVLEAYIVNDNGVEDLSELDEDALMRAYGNNGVDISGYRAYTSRTTNHYVFSAEVNLAEASTGKMFYLTELTDGTIWAQLVDYSACLSGWEYGKACVADAFERDSEWNVTEISYVLADVEIDPAEPEEPDPEEPDPVDPDPVDPDPVDPDPTDPEPEEPDNPDPIDPDPADPNDSTEEPANSEENNEAVDNNGGENENVTTETGKEPTATEKPTATLATVVTTTENSNTQENSSNTSETSSNNSSSQVSVNSNTSETTSEASEEINDASEVAEGAGETTLEVPELGKDNKMEEILRNLSWIFIFFTGALTGTISTWFLLSDRKKMTDSGK